MHTTRRSTATAVAVGLAALVGLAACGSDKASSTTTAAATGATTAPASGSSDFCNASLAIETDAGPNFDPTASQEQQAAAFVDWAKSTILPLGTKLQSVAPADLQSDITTALASVQKLADTGDPSAMSDPAFEAATKKIHDESVTSCGWMPVAVTATEYKFDGVPSTLKAGVVSFDLTNNGKESHEIVLVRKNDGVTLDAKTLLALPQDEALSKVTQLGEAEADPGSSDQLVATLTPGSYIYTCFVPVGTVPGQPVPENAQPHAMMGMYGEFTVA